MAGAGSAVAGAAVSAAVCLAATPYLARLTATVPDRDERRWWTGAPVPRRRQAETAASALVLGGLAGAAAGWGALLPAFLALALAAAPLVVIDFEHHRLPNRLVHPAAVGAAVLLALAAALRDEWGDYLRAVEGAAAVFVVLFALFVISPRSFGRGDVRVGAILGGYLGYHSWIAVFYGIFAGFVLGTVVALAMMATRRVGMKTALAFGPMLVVGALLVLALDIGPAFVG